VSDYRLDDLGWRAFERLVQSLLKLKISLAVEAWGGSGDQGNDAYSRDPLPFPGLELSPGPFTFQCKFVEHANAAGAKPEPALERAVRTECKRIEERREAGNPDPRQYVLITNAPMDAEFRDKVTELIRNPLPEARITLWDGGDVGVMLDDAPAIRAAYPQLLSLRDLQALIDDAVGKEILVRSTFGLDRAAEVAATFISTGAYAEAWETLREHHFAVLTGPPEAGKTAIARMIGFVLAAGGWECFECLAPGDILRRHDRHRPQLFIADDAFGSTEFRFDVADAWSAQLDTILRIADETHWIIWTARSAILNEALDRVRFPDRAAAFPEPARVTIDAGHLTMEERARILHAHCKQARLDEAMRTSIRAAAPQLVHHHYFTPERARLLAGEAARLTIRDATPERLLSFISEPTRVMRQSFDVLPDDRKLFLLAVLDSDGSLASVQQSYARLLGSARGKPAPSLARELTEHFLRVSGTGQALRMYWVHPSWRDIVIERLADDPPLRRVFLERCGIDAIAMALSVAGGREGARTAPLLHGPEDATRIAARLPELITDAYSANHLMHTVLRVTEDLRARKDPRLRLCMQIDRAVHDGVRDRVAAAPRAMVGVSMKAWYELARRLADESPMPMQRLWTETLAVVERKAAVAAMERQICVEFAKELEAQRERFRTAGEELIERMKQWKSADELRRVDGELRRLLAAGADLPAAIDDRQPYVRVTTDALDLWADLIDALAADDPDALRKLGFPKKWRRQLDAAAATLQAILEYGVWHERMHFDSDLAHVTKRSIEKTAARFATMFADGSPFDPIRKAARGTPKPAYGHSGSKRQPLIKDPFAKQLDTIAGIFADF